MRSATFGPTPGERATVALSRVATAFGLTLARLVEEISEGSPRLIRVNEQPVWRDPRTAYRRRQVFLSPTNPLELVEVDLPPRQREIAAYVARGLRNAEVAALLGLSPLTVRNQLASIFRKLDVSTRAELVFLVLGGSAG